MADFSRRRPGRPLPFIFPSFPSFFRPWMTEENGVESFFSGDANRYVASWIPFFFSSLCGLFYFFPLPPPSSVARVCWATFFFFTKRVYLSAQTLVPFWRSARRRVVFSSFLAGNRQTTGDFVWSCAETSRAGESWRSTAPDRECVFDVVRTICARKVRTIFPLSARSKCAQIAYRLFSNCAQIVLKSCAIIEDKNGPSPHCFFFADRKKSHPQSCAHSRLSRWTNVYVRCMKKKKKSLSSFPRRHRAAEKKKSRCASKTRRPFLHSDKTTASRFVKTFFFSAVGASRKTQIVRIEPRTKSRSTFGRLPRLFLRKWPRKSRPNSTVARPRSKARRQT